MNSEIDTSGLVFVNRDGSKTEFPNEDNWYSLSFDGLTWHYFNALSNQNVVEYLIKDTTFSSSLLGFINC